MAAEAKRRAVELRAELYGAKSKAENEALQAIYAYEEVLTKKNGKKTKASVVVQRKFASMLARKMTGRSRCKWPS